MEGRGGGQLGGREGSVLIRGGSVESLGMGVFLWKSGHC